MKDIFQQSERTVVWLGEESEDSESAVRLIKSLAVASRSHSTHKIGQIFKDLKSFPPLYDPAWRALAIMLHRPWFHRAWIVQEVSVAKDVLIVCGRAVIPWDDLVCGIRHAVDLGLFIAYGGSMTYQALRLFASRSNFQSHTPPMLHDILLGNRSFLATDARDKVFGLLSLADPEDVRAMGVTPDYRLTVDRVYKQITKALLKRPDLSAFSASCVYNASLGQRLPSWVSDWSVSDPSMPLKSTDSLNYGDVLPNISSSNLDFNAARSTISQPVFGPGENTLGLEGLLVDQVESVGALSRTRYLRHVSHMFELFVQCYDILETMKDWEVVARAHSPDPYIAGKSHFHAYWHTLCAGRVPPDLASIRKDPRFKYYIITRSLRPFVRLVIRWFPRSERDTWYNRLFYSMFQTAWRVCGFSPAKIQRIGFPPERRLSNHRRMVRTKGGYIALAPRSTKQGDWIGVFRGGNLPLVVRRDGDNFILIGESYVYGLMNGEAWDESKCRLIWFK